MSSSIHRRIPVSPPMSAATYRVARVADGRHRSTDPLTELCHHGIACDAYYARSDGRNPPYYASLPGAEPVLRARRSVADRLARINRRLGACGVELLVLDAYRSLECQQGLWEFFLADATRRRRGQGRAAIERHALKFCSDPRRFDPADARTWPTHMTGGAVDVTLKRIGGLGEPLFMGGIFDDPSEVSRTDYFERNGRSASSASDTEARLNRRQLYWAMRSEGFENLPTEWWHYDWGTQLWAYRRSRRLGRSVAACFGPAASASPPERRPSA